MSQGDYEFTPPRFSEAALAREFTELHRDHLRYVHDRKQWYWLTEAGWQKDQTNRALREAGQLCVEVAATCYQPGLARSLCKLSTANGLLRCARAMRELATTSEQLQLPAIHKRYPRD